MFIYKKEIPFDFLKQRGFTIIPIKPGNELHYANNILTIAPRHIMTVGNQSRELPLLLPAMEFFS